MDVKTFGLKLSEVRPCDCCGEKIAPMFQYIQIRHAVFNARNVNGVLGIMHGWSNTSAQALKVAEVLAPAGDEAVEVLDEAISKEELGDKAGLTKSGTFSSYLSDLKTARLIVVSRDTVAANRETLFL